MWDGFTDSENKIVPKLKWILKLKTKMLSEYIKLITWLRLFNIAAVKLLHKTQCHDPKSSVEIQETQESQNNPEKEQQTVCQDLFYLISVWARRAFQPGLPVKQCCWGTSAAGQPVLPGTAVYPHAKEWSWIQYLYYTQWLTHSDLNLLVLLLLLYVCVCTCDWVWVYVMRWKSEYYFVESVLSFLLYMDSRNWTLVARLLQQAPLSWSYIAGPDHRP